MQAKVYTNANQLSKTEKLRTKRINGMVRVPSHQYHVLILPLSVDVNSTLTHSEISGGDKGRDRQGCRPEGVGGLP